MVGEEESYRGMWKRSERKREELEKRITELQEINQNLKLAGKKDRTRFVPIGMWFDFRKAGWFLRGMQMSEKWLIWCKRRCIVTRPSWCVLCAKSSFVILLDYRFVLKNAFWWDVSISSAESVSMNESTSEFESVLILETWAEMPSLSTSVWSGWCETCVGN